MVIAADGHEEEWSDTEVTTFCRVVEQPYRRRQGQVSGTAVTAEAFGVFLGPNMTKRQDELWVDDVVAKLHVMDATQDAHIGIQAGIDGHLATVTVK
ncbi:hypothetical protein D3C86_2007590 [compost metagenome]